MNACERRDRERGGESVQAIRLVAYERLPRVCLGEWLVWLSILGVDGRRVRVAIVDQNNRLSECNQADYFFAPHSKCPYANEMMDQILVGYYI